jgi:hypothetical protein
MSLSVFAAKRKKLFAGLGVFLVAAVFVFGIMAENGWLPATDPLTGKKTGWFGHELATNASSSWNPYAAPLPTPTPQLSKDYIYAGQRLLAVEDANANAAPPADLAVWRPAGVAMWWVLGGPGSQQTTYPWGTDDDRPVPGDYDGDGKTDFAVFRPSEGNWWIMKSSDNTLAVISWGLATDKTVQADYDGDGKTDVAVWRPDSGLWCILRSSDGTAYFEGFGISTDVPAPADYDGDGLADVSVLRPSQNFFYTLYTSGPSRDSYLPQTGGTPVSADYDGDGKADYAVRNGADWVIRQSSDNQVVTVPWQQAGDTAVQNDYDGDGKCDIAVWRPADSPAGTLGNWYIRNSHDLSTRIQQWGTTGDIPVPAFYRR